MSLVNFYKNNKEAYLISLRKRGLDTQLLDQLDKLIEEKSKKLTDLQNRQREINEKTPSSVPTERIRQDMRTLAANAKIAEDLLKKINEELNELLNKLPNLVSPDSPEGAEEDFKILKEWGEKPEIESPKDHEQIGKDLNLIDFEAGTKVAGTKFYYLKNEAVFLEFALIHFVLNILKSEGFIPMITPQIAKNSILESIGFAPKGPEKQVYGLDEEGLSLIGTSEITLGGYHQDETIPAEKLPLKYAGFSTCFRTEAGAYGKHSKGLYRVHQFDKLEMFIYCLPEDSEKMHQYLLSLEEKIFQELNIPYRVVDIAAGDLGAAAYRKFDVEAWMPGRGDYGEVTSASNTTNYQAMRLNEKFDKNGQKDFVHTLNGTAIAISRALIAILENFQQADGSVKIPEVLVSYTGFAKISPKNSSE
ncbi:serine--tRNA ligase [Candidatus Daviesbacteria bacterium]|nr:serine--tRNA ligase [Candidatus Daviesbacteria bacterium]